MDLERCDQHGKSLLSSGSEHPYCGLSTAQLESSIFMRFPQKAWLYVLGAVPLSAIVVASGLVALMCGERHVWWHGGRGWGFSAPAWPCTPEQTREPVVARTEVAAGPATAACSPAGSLWWDSGDPSGEAPSCPALDPQSVASSLWEVSRL